MSNFQGRWYLKGVPLGIARSVIVPVAEGASVGLGSAALDGVGAGGSGVVTYVPASGDGTVTLDGATGTGAGTVVNGPAGAGSTVLDDAGGNGAGTVVNGPAGAGTATLDDVAGAGTGTVTNGPAGAGAATLDDAAGGGAGTVVNGPAGAGATTLDDAVGTGAGTATSGPTGAGTVTLDNATGSGSGTVVNGPTGTGAVTLDDATSSGGNAALNPDIPVPYVAFVGAQNAHPTQASVEIPGGTEDTWSIEFRYSASEVELLAGTYLGGGIYAVGVGASGSINTGLASRPSGAFTAAYARTIIGTEHSFWSPIATHGGAPATLRADSTLVTADTATRKADEG